MIIKEIEQCDNSAIEQIIKATLQEFELPMLGTVYEDQEIIKMYESYQSENEIYYVIKDEGKIVGGGGIKQLKDFDDDVCELQKMYLDPKARGKGVGSNLLELCLSFARENNFSLCYLETMPYMLDAQKLYRKNGFIYINNHMGDTGHYSCPVWMTKKL